MKASNVVVQYQYTKRLPGYDVVVDAEYSKTVNVSVYGEADAIVTNELRKMYPDDEYFVVKSIGYYPV